MKIIITERQNKMLVDNLPVGDLLEDYVTITDEEIDYSVKDDLYFFMFDTFGSYLKKFHKQQCD